MVSMQTVVCNTGFVNRVWNPNSSFVNRVCITAVPNIINDYKIYLIVEDARKNTRTDTMILLNLFSKLSQPPHYAGGTQPIYKSVTVNSTL